VLPENRRVRFQFQDMAAVRAAALDYMTDPLVPARTFNAYVPILRRLMQSARYRAAAAGVQRSTTQRPVVSSPSPENGPQ
jgi:hypothetical protein